MLRSLRISLLMQLLFGGALLILVGVIGFDMARVIPQKRAAERVVEVSKAGQAVFSALQALRLERSPPRLNSKPNRRLPANSSHASPSYALTRDCRCMLRASLASITPP